MTFPPLFCPHFLCHKEIPYHLRLSNAEMSTDVLLLVMSMPAFYSIRKINNKTLNKKYANA